LPSPACKSCSKYSGGVLSVTEQKAIKVVTAFAAWKYSYCVLSTMVKYCIALRAMTQVLGERYATRGRPPPGGSPYLACLAIMKIIRVKNDLQSISLQICRTHSMRLRWTSHPGKDALHIVHRSHVPGDGSINGPLSLTTCLVPSALASPLARLTSHVDRVRRVIFVPMRTAMPGSACR